ncbi:hypothetical protein NHQ30_004817 [Ciborinia camelliae]|nr:hypothetical protein NHQ30_004817 [Ciborinia camelliae]
MVILPASVPGSSSQRKVNPILINLSSSNPITMPPAKKAAGKGGKGKGKDDAGDAKETKVKGAQQINVRHILMTEALAKLEGGAKFDDVARDFSEDKARAGDFWEKKADMRDNVGGALGWKGRGDLDAEFEKVAFEMEASTTAKPKYREVKTGFGYHIVMVEGRK